MKKQNRNYYRILNEFINLQSPFDVDILGTIIYEQGYPFLSLHTHSKLAKYNVVINSGAHGEETIGIKVMLRFLQEFDTGLLGTYNFIIFPIVNPHGYCFSVRRNGNKQFVNGNCYTKEPLPVSVPEFLLMKEKIPNKVDLFIDIHADRTKNGYYIYERKRPEKKSLAIYGVDALLKEKLPVIEAGTVYKEKCERGIIVQPEKDNSMDDFMFNRGAIYSLCLEIPGKLTEDKQIIGGLILLKTILTNFKEAIK